MTSAQLILVSVSSALIAVIAMLVVATALRARTRDGGIKTAARTKAQQTRAQKTALRAQKRAERATTRAQKAAQKAEAADGKPDDKEKKRTESTGTTPLETDAKKDDDPKDRPLEGPSTDKEQSDEGADLSPQNPSEPSGSDDAGPTTEAGRRAAAAHEARSSGTGERPADKDVRKKK